MPALFSTVCGTPLLLATARLTDGEREQTREEITCLHVSYAEEVTKLANTEMPLDSNVVFLAVSEHCSENVG